MEQISWQNDESINILFNVYVCTSPEKQTYFDPLQKVNNLVGQMYMHGGGGIDLHFLPSFPSRCFQGHFTLAIRKTNLPENA